MDGLEQFGLTIGGNTATPEREQPSSVSELLALLGHGEATLEPEKIAALLNQSDSAWRLSWNVYQVIRDYVLEPGYDPVHVAASHDRAARLVQELDPELLASALASQASISDRRKLLDTLIDIVPPKAVETTAVAAASAYGRPFSTPLAGIVRKLQIEASTLGEDVRPQAVATLRSLVHDMIGMWSYGSFDTALTGVDHFFEESPEQVSADVKPEPERIVALALEAGAVGPPLWEAVHTMVVADEVRELIGMLKLAPHDNRASSMIASQFSNAQRLGNLLREPEVDFGAVDVLLRHMGQSATDALLEELTTSGSRVTRRGILDRLASLGPGIGAAVTERLIKEERWFVVRNMLHVLREAGCAVQNVALPTFQNHSDARVRREAMQLLFKDPIARERAITNGLKDTDPYMIRAALKESRRGLPDVAVPVLSKRIMEQDFPPEFRVAAINMLGRSKSVLALDALLRYVQGGTTLLGKPKLASKTPEMLAALRGLARSWPHERRAKPLLELAATATDPQIAGALELTKPDPIKDIEDDVSE